MTDPIKIDATASQPYPAKALVAVQNLRKAAEEMIAASGFHGIVGVAPDWPNCPTCQKPMDRVCHPPRVDGHWQQYVCACGEKTEEIRVA